AGVCGCGAAAACAGSLLSRGEAQAHTRVASSSAIEQRRSMIVSFAFQRPAILCFGRLRTAFILLALLSLPAHATCMFARDTKPQDWYDWAEVLVAADVTGVEQRGRMDVVSLRVVETFKGPQAAEARSEERR